MKHILVVFCISIFLIGCGSIESIAPSVDKLFLEKAGLTEEEGKPLLKGRSVYLGRCSSCHSLTAVDDFFEDDFRFEFPPMYKKAKLNAQQRQHLEAYLRKAGEINQELIKAREEIKLKNNNRK